MTIKETLKGYNLSVTRKWRFVAFFYYSGSTAMCAVCRQPITSGIGDNYTYKNYCMDCAEVTEVDDGSE